MKLIYKSLIAFSLLVLVSANFNVRAQVGIIRGKVVDSGSGNAVEYAYVLNYSLHKNSYSNTVGEFSLAAQQGDTLVLYAMGYFYQKIIVTATMLGTQHETAFPLIQQPLELSEAHIIGAGTYDDFKRQFLALKQSDTKTELLARNIADISHRVAVESYQKAKDEQKLNGITFASVPILTPDEKERIKLAKIIEKEQVRDQIYQKYNPRVVKTVTGLADDDEIIEFMVFCHFSDAYLLKVTEYDLATRIALKFELFKQKKLDEKSKENPLNRIDEMLNHIA
jgi:hypothetical protein